MLFGLFVSMFCDCMCVNFIAVLSDMLTIYSPYCFWPKCVKIPIFCQLWYLIFHPLNPFLLSHAVNFTHVLVLLLEHFPGWVDWQNWTPCRIIKECCWICWWTDHGSWKTPKEGSQGNVWRWWWFNVVCSFICCMMCCSRIILRNSLTRNFRSKIFLLTLCLPNTLESYEVQLRISTAACRTWCTELSCTKALQLVGLVSSEWSEFTWHGNMICSSVKLFKKKWRLVRQSSESYVCTESLIKWIIDFR